MSGRGRVRRDCHGAGRRQWHGTAFQVGGIFVHGPGGENNCERFSTSHCLVVGGLAIWVELVFILGSG